MLDVLPETYSFGALSSEHGRDDAIPIPIRSEQHS